MKGTWSYEFAKQIILQLLSKKVMTDQELIDALEYKNCHLTIDSFYDIMSRMEAEQLIDCCLLWHENGPREFIRSKGLLYEIRQRGRILVGEKK